MESKRLNLAKDTKTIHLKKGGDIDVPQGESHYHLKQLANEEQSYVFHLRHADSRVRITGLVDARLDQTPTLATTVIHHAPRTLAETLIRTLSQDQAFPHYSGLIRMEHGAEQCESYLNHHALLLGEEAQSWTLPSLEILANEVKCSHAATVRTITDDDLFYARSRGITATEARTLLIEAFLHDVQN